MKKYIWFTSRHTLCLYVGENGKKIPVQVPAIEICFMSIDEIARIFFQVLKPIII